MSRHHPARLIPFLMMAGLSLVLLPNSGCHGGVFPEVTVTATLTATVVPTATASPLATSRSLELRGSGTQTGMHSGTCSGQTCGGTSGGCDCLLFSGNLISTVVGNSTWSANVTINTDDCTSTGTSGGFCCNGDGVLNSAGGNGASASVLSIAIIGPICMDPEATVMSLEANFSVLGAMSSGRFANAAGTGQFNIYSDSSGNAYLAALGEVSLP